VKNRGKFIKILVNYVHSIWTHTHMIQKSVNLLLNCALWNTVNWFLDHSVYYFSTSPSWRRCLCFNGRPLSCSHWNKEFSAQP